MLYLVNNSTSNIKLNFFVNNKLWDATLTPVGRVGSYLIIPSEDHKRAITPHLKQLNLALVENDTVLVPVLPEKPQPNLELDPPTISRTVAKIEVDNSKQTIEALVTSLYDKTYKEIKAPKAKEITPEKIIEPVTEESTILSEMAAILVTSAPEEITAPVVDLDSPEAEELMQLTKAELKEKCTKRNLNTLGNKTDLVERLLLPE